MRPVDKGTSPRAFTNYQDAVEPLQDKLGRYCSYCERFLAQSIDVEHIRPKSLQPELQFTWDNFLLACKNCNSTKGNKQVLLNNHYWPDRDNTFRAFNYAVPSGKIIVNHTLTPNEQAIAKQTLRLIGLDRHPGTVNKPTPKDKRWSQRIQTMGVAQRSLKRLIHRDDLWMREQIVETAIGRGFFSVWMTVFKHDVDMKHRFVAAFSGTDAACFDVNCIPIPRAGGQL